MAQQMTPKMASLETTDDGNEDNRQQPKIYAKNSMDRFGDDLYGLILSYLSLEDRFRCECVSKQFQRTVFESVVDITLSDTFINKILKIKGQLLTRIVIKFTNIKTIDCRIISEKYKKRVPEVLQIFRDNCRHLREIYCNLRENSSQTMSSLLPLITRIGNLCKEFWISGPIINGIDPNSESQSLIHCHRLSHLNINSLSHVFHNTSGQILVNNLTIFELSHYRDKDKELLSAFVAHNQSLKSLTFRTSTKSQETLNEMSVQLSRLPQLRDLRLGFELYSNELSVNETLLTIGLNCKQLQRLTLMSLSCSDYSMQLTLDSLGSYRRLKRLQLQYINIDINADPFKHCQRLTHLELILTPKIAKVLENCHQNCSRLQYLYIYYTEDMIESNRHTYQIDTECLSHISRLPALQMLVFQCYGSTRFNDNDLNAVLSSSPKLKTIEIRLNNRKKLFSK
ncbi:unnamed protein product [Medioppia subpectinata]|uniref:F-box domain-containing protein n=1 Tax=Medioppia subpectinata TaxID=1979941 RepID=A0A7R9L6P3_9ACAR|nr:unnamed protein product [Medioppia subpectinata]CAG2116135.1 unnamed protein product [Medioppia subpectinata]